MDLEDTREKFMQAVQSKVKAEIIPLLFSDEVRTKWDEQFRSSDDHFRYTTLQTHGEDYKSTFGLKPQIAVRDPRAQEERLLEISEVTRNSTKNPPCRNYHVPLAVEFEGQVVNMSLRVYFTSSATPEALQRFDEHVENRTKGRWLQHEFGEKLGLTRNDVLVSSYSVGKDGEPDSVLVQLLTEETENMNTEELTPQIRNIIEDDNAEISFMGRMYAL